MKQQKNAVKFEVNYLQKKHFLCYLAAIFSHIISMCYIRDLTNKLFKNQHRESSGLESRARCENITKNLD